MLDLEKFKEILPSYLDKKIFDSSQLIPFFNNIFKEEVDFRDARAKEINVKISNFPYKKTMNLMTLRFIENKENIVF